jgi:hypothetical protein
MHACLGLHRGLLQYLPVHLADDTRNGRAGKPDRLLHRLNRKLLLPGAILYHALLGQNE